MDDRRGNIFKNMCLIQFLGGGDEGIKKSLLNLLFASLKLGFFSEEKKDKLIQF